MIVALPPIRLLEREVGYNLMTIIIRKLVHNRIAISVSESILSRSSLGVPMMSVMSAKKNNA